MGRSKGPGRQSDVLEKIVFTKFIFMLLVAGCTPEKTTWVWPEAITYPEERNVLVAVPVVPVTIITLN